MTAIAPDYCPQCGVNLKEEGYPEYHRTDEGSECPFTWATGTVDDYEWD